MRMRQFRCYRPCTLLTVSVGSLSRKPRLRGLCPPWYRHSRHDRRQEVRLGIAHRHVLWHAHVQLA